MTKEKLLSRNETKYLVNHSIDFNSLPKICYLCKEKAGYEIIHSKEKGTRRYQYATGGGKSLCKRCWKVNRFFGRMSDYCFMLPLQLLFILWLKISSLFKGKEVR